MYLTLRTLQTTAMASMKVMAMAMAMASTCCLLPRSSPSHLCSRMLFVCR